MKFNIFHYLSEKPAKHIIIAGYIMVFILGAIQISIQMLFHSFSINDKISYVLYYMLPVVLVSWYAGARHGMKLSIICIIIWFSSELAIYYPNINVPVLLLNSIARLTLFLVIAYILHNFKKEREIAHVDFLTKLPNRRYFFELLNSEIYRSRRFNRPLTLVYMDVDNFKEVNDNFGHQAGDRLLKIISRTMMKKMRSTDVISRVGGDEFAILFLETDSKEASRILTKLKRELYWVMREQMLPITISFGCVTFRKFDFSVSEMLHMADERMYESKRAGKNAIRRRVVR